MRVLTHARRTFLLAPLLGAVSLLLLGAFAIVGMPWLVAAVAIAAIYVPRWLRASR